MVQIYEIYQEKGYRHALRQYSPEGKYYLIKFSQTTGDIVHVDELNEIPPNWSQHYVNELLKTGEILKTRVL